LTEKLTAQEWKTKKDQNAAVENAGVENAGGDCSGWNEYEGHITEIEY